MRSIHYGADNVSRSVARAAAALGAAVMLGIGSDAALAVPKSGSYDQLETVASPLLTVHTTSHLKFKGSKYWLEAADTQDFAIFNNIVDGQSFYHYVPLLKEASRVELPKDIPTALDILAKNTAGALNGATKTGETTIGEINCDTYTRTTQDGVKATLYVDKDPQFPYIVKSVIYRADTQVTDTQTIENIKLNMAIADSQFNLPAGTKIDQAPPPGSTPAPGGAATTPTASSPGASAAPAGDGAPTPAGAPATGGS